ECFDVGHTNSVWPLLDKGLLERPLQFSFIMGVLGGIRATAENLALQAREAPADSTWEVIGISHDQWRMVGAALSLGGNVPERLSLRMAQPIVHHRSPEFEQVFGRVREGLQWLFQTRQDVVQYAASGTGAMEGAFVNFLRKGDTAIVVDAGKFGERWAKLARSYGVNAVVLKVEWGSAVDPGAVHRALEENPNARAVFVQANESSTGVAHPVQKLAQVTKDHPAILVVDAISALGAFDLPMDAWGIDVLVSACHKALGLPPGISFLAANARAWKLNETADLPRFYFDVRRERDSQRKNQTAWPPAIALVE